MIANLISFYGFTKNEILWKMSMLEVSLWVKQMLSIKSGVPLKREITADEIKAQFTWNEETKRYE